MRNLILFTLFFIASCSSVEELIKSERIHDGMTKSSLWDAMLDTYPSEDITFPGCYRAYYPDKQLEVLAPESMNIFYVFEKVTLPTNPLNCEHQGNGYLLKVHQSYDALLSTISSSSSLSKVTGLECPNEYKADTWTDGCMGITKKGPISKQGYWVDGYLNGQGSYNHDDGTIYIGGFKNDEFHGKGVWSHPDGTRYEGDWQYDARHGDGNNIYSDGSVYEGHWEFNQRHGQGTYTWPDGSKYVGEFSYDLMQGQGTQTWPDGSKYVGEHKEDVANGQGIYTWSDGSRYEGEYYNDLKWGQGTDTWADGSRYEGEYYNDLKWGQGTDTWADGSRYEGEYYNDLKQGQGTYTWPDGTNYVGEYYNDLMHGHGTYTWSDGRIYMGEYDNDLKWGQGTYTWPDGTNYVGEYYNDLMHGHGTYTWSDGRIYSGELNYDRFDGQGTYTYPNNDKYEGEFLDDKKHGKGIFTYNDGRIERGEWNFDEFIEERMVSEISGPTINNENSADLMEASSGSGFMVTHSGHIVTNYHVIEHCEKIKVRNIGTASIEAKVIARDEINDLVVLKADIKSSQVLSISKNKPNKFTGNFCSRISIWYQSKQFIEIFSGNSKCLNWGWG